jgi:lipoprotein-releasing system permease protein
MGLLSAIRGCTLGTIIGCALSFITPYVTAHFKAWFGIELLNEDIYFINFIPTRLMSFDVVLVVSCALLMSVLASIYPAIKASLVDPAKEINL